ncbi:MAG TPA: CCA tRNA nucleotidyltransferase [Pseudomonadales bacterium]|nr:CCA tRNA nucleotidyltransferase [Pseudomonadales bacterium]
MTELGQGPIREKLDMPIPEDLLDIYDMMSAAGHQFYIVGGAVRDRLLNRTPKDYDVATNAPPEKVIEVLSQDPALQIKPVGEAFGVVLVKTPAGNEFEIATFRKDIGKGRRPDEVEFTTIEGDVSRRDLTINALFYDIGTGEVVDYVGGLRDIVTGVVRTVGNPADRFDEDKLRVLRAVRFAGRVGSDLDEETAQAIKDDPYLDQVSHERIRDEFLKGIAQAVQVPHFLGITDELGLFDEIFPSAQINRDFARTKDPAVQLALLLRDNPVDSVVALLRSMKYWKDEEIKPSTFLIALQDLDASTAVDMKKKFKNAKLSPAQVTEFAEESGMRTQDIQAFLKFVEMPVAGDPQEFMAQGLKGPDIGRAMDDAEQQQYLDVLGESLVRIYINMLLRS